MKTKNKEPNKYLLFLRDKFIQELWKDPKKNYTMVDISEVFNSRLTKQRIWQIIKNK